MNRELIREKLLKRRRFNIKSRNMSFLPVVYIFKSNKFIYGQCISGAGDVLVASSDVRLNILEKSKIKVSFIIGTYFGNKLKKLNIDRFIIDVGYFNIRGSRITAFINGIKTIV